ncbi:MULTISPECIES: RNA-directed DNA polymerase [Flavobacterium]|uniref:RNA-directed DNA polymerase n=1 Tax=Flavobacterium hankyongi TaxID=1176532 RepID=A0ABP9A4U2_9FLAO|nr:RNA-directed DNA polymerase [Flavobacterium sp. N1846]
MDYYKLAIDNISKFGDTDIFPFPIENALFYDKPDEVKKILEKISSDFDNWSVNYPIESINSCIPVGITGFRWAAIIDPIWNAYLLYEVLKISKDIESKRINLNKNSVFSYRIKLKQSTGKLFDNEYTWRKFYETARTKASNASYVIKFDISDFYTRIYHHRLENALLRSTTNTTSVKRIMNILTGISKNASYGLPVGGNAARILAEALLNSFDQIINSKKIDFCRYVDDYIIFADSKEDAFKKLNWCAEFLLRNEGLTLQKNKTQILTSTEFISQSTVILEGEDDDEGKERASFMRINIKYDPYSTTAEEDYKELKKKLSDFDIVPLIKTEIRKSRIHHAFGKQLLNAVNILEEEPLNLAFKTIASNLDAFYPVYPSVMQLANKKLLECDDETVSFFLNTLSGLVFSNSYIIQTDNNASYTARVLSLKNTETSIQAIDQIASNSRSTLVKMNCMYAMTNLYNSFWLSDLKSQFSTLTSWERRAFIASSYFMNEEGTFWRQKIESQFSEFESLLKSWVGNKNPSATKWKLPL